jgi:AcrR family transcriptional regulator
VTRIPIWYSGQVLASPTRDVILDAVDALLARYGYSKMTIDDVAAAAGIGKGTIYLHFESKEDLVLSHVDRIVERVVARLADIAASRAPWPGRVRRMLRERVLMRLDAVQHYSESLSDLLAAIRPALLVRHKQHFAREAEALARPLAEAGFRPEAALETAQAMLIATNALLPFSLSAKELGARAEIQRKVDRIAALLVKGASVPSGRGREWRGR